LKEVFSNGKKGFKKNLPALPARTFFILISTYTVFFVQFGINLLVSFSKTEIAVAKAPC